MLEFTLSLKEVPVTLDGKEYKLVELNAKQRDQFLNGVGGRMKYVNGKLQGMSNYEGLQASLLSLCLYDSEGKLVKTDIIQSFPAGLVSKLFKEAQKISGLDEDAAQESKND